MLVHGRVTPSSKFAGTHLYTWVERGTVRVRCLAQDAVPRPGLELTIRPPRFSFCVTMDNIVMSIVFTEKPVTITVGIWIVAIDAINVMDMVRRA